MGIVDDLYFFERKTYFQQQKNRISEFPWPWTQENVSTVQRCCFLHCLFYATEMFRLTKKIKPDKNLGFSDFSAAGKFIKKHFFLVESLISCWISRYSAIRSLGQNFHWKRLILRYQISQIGSARTTLTLLGQWSNKGGFVMMLVGPVQVVEWDRLCKS